MFAAVDDIVINVVGESEVRSENRSLCLDFIGMAMFRQNGYVNLWTTSEAGELSTVLNGQQSD